MSNPNTPQPTTAGEFIEITLFADKKNGRKLGKGHFAKRVDQLLLAWNTIEAAEKVPPLDMPDRLARTASYTANVIYMAYPRHVGKSAALAKIRTLMAKGTDWHFMLERTKKFAECVDQWPEAERKYVPHPATWFNQGRYEDNPKEWELKIVKDEAAEPPKDYTKF